MAHMGRAMTTPWGLLGSSFVALFPAWRNRVITPRLLEWDGKFATPAERELAARENLRSGIPELIIAGLLYYEKQGRTVPFIRAGDALDGYPPPDAPGLVAIEPSAAPGTRRRWVSGLGLLPQLDADAGSPRSITTCLCFTPCYALPLHTRWA